MKTIQIPDKLYEHLVQMGKEIKTQNNRATAKPYIYQIQKDERVYGIDSAFADGDFVWVYKEDITHTVDPKIEELPENFNEDEWFKGYYKEYVIYDNFFFTEKGIRKHIEQNQHHYKIPTRDYISYAFRNPEMDTVVKLMIFLAKNEKVGE